MTTLNETTKVRPKDLLAAAAAIAAGTQAYGEVIMFINPPEGEPGHFDWLALHAHSGSPNSWLDITRPSTDQGALVGPTSVGQITYTWGEDPFYDPTYCYTAGGASVTAEPGAPLFGYTSPLDGGDTIDGAAGTFLNESAHWTFQWHYMYGYVISTAFPFGEAKYIGVRFSDVDGYHYGWVGVVLNFWSYYYDLDLDAVITTTWISTPSPGATRRSRACRSSRASPPRARWRRWRSGRS
jgi:hypothetical protein